MDPSGWPSMVQLQGFLFWDHELPAASVQRRPFLFAFSLFLKYTLAVSIILLFVLVRDLTYLMIYVYAAGCDSCLDYRRVLPYASASC